MKEAGGHGFSSSHAVSTGRAQKNIQYLQWGEKNDNI